MACSVVPSECVVLETVELEPSGLVVTSVDEVDVEPSALVVDDVDVSVVIPVSGSVTVTVSELVIEPVSGSISVLDDFVESYSTSIVFVTV